MGKFLLTCLVVILFILLQTEEIVSISRKGSGRLSSSWKPSRPSRPVKPAEKPRRPAYNPPVHSEKKLDNPARRPSSHPIPPPYNPAHPPHNPAIPKNPGRLPLYPVNPQNPAHPPNYPVNPGNPPPYNPAHRPNNPINPGNPPPYNPAHPPNYPVNPGNPPPYNPAHRPNNPVNPGNPPPYNPAHPPNYPVNPGNPPPYNPAHPPNNPVNPGNPPPYIPAHPPNNPVNPGNPPPYNPAHPPNYPVNPGNPPPYNPAHRPNNPVNPGNPPPYNPAHPPNYPVNPGNPPPYNPAHRPNNPVNPGNPPPYNPAHPPNYPVNPGNPPPYNPAYPHPVKPQNPAHPPISGQPSKSKTSSPYPINPQNPGYFPHQPYNPQNPQWNHYNPKIWKPKQPKTKMKHVAGAAVAGAAAGALGGYFLGRAMSNLHFPFNNPNEERWWYENRHRYSDRVYYPQYIEPVPQDIFVRDCVNVTVKEYVEPTGNKTEDEMEAKVVTHVVREMCIEQYRTFSSSSRGSSRPHGGNPADPKPKGDEVKYIVGEPVVEDPESYILGSPIAKMYFRFNDSEEERWWSENRHRFATHVYHPNASQPVSREAFLNECVNVTVGEYVKPTGNQTEDELEARVVTQLANEKCMEMYPRFTDLTTGGSYYNHKPETTLEFKREFKHQEGAAPEGASGHTLPNNAVSDLHVSFENVLLLVHPFAAAVLSLITPFLIF